MLKDISGRPVEEIELTDGSDLGTVFARYAERYPRLKEYKGSIVLTRNRQFSNPAEKLSDGDEVAFLPPVSGGAGPYTHEITEPGGHFAALTRQSIDKASIVGRISEGTDGAVVSFDGIVRNNTKGRPTLYLDYECYEEMAVKMMARIGVEIAREHAIGRIGMVHRLGRMNIGETSVAIVVAAPHRKPAFAAALEAINRLKRLVPIWKKEYFADGEVWVEGEWDESVRAAG